MEANPLFSYAADFVNNTSRHIFLTGKAGTGKTTFLKYIRENTHKKTAVVAPTGVAAINAGGVTMHSLFQIPLGPFVPTSHKVHEGVTDQYTLFRNIRISEEKRSLLRDLELLIIDEVSMVRCDTLDAVDSILRYFRKSPDIPFGGVQLLFIGDLYQLPPVIRDEEWSILKDHYESPFFFDSRAVKRSDLVCIELRKIYRQSQQEFIDILNRIRNGEVTSEDLKILNDRNGSAILPNAKYVTLTTHNHIADRINADELQNLSGPLYEYKGVVEGDFPDKTLPTESTLQLKVGAQVMFIRNDKGEQRRYYNGKIATVKAINKDSVRVLLENDEELVLEKETWNNIRYSYNQSNGNIDEEKLGSFTQYPIRLAWAITIHKSQGLTFQHAIIDAGQSFAPGQVYVALSRCTTLDGLVLRSRIGSSSISTDPRVVAFSQKVMAEQELGKLLEIEKRQYHAQVLAKTFDFEMLLDLFKEYLSDLPRRKLPSVKEATASASQIVLQLEELQTVGIKFQEQVRMIVAEEQFERLTDRVTKAIQYFSTSLNNNVLATLEHYVLTLKTLPGATKNHRRRVSSLSNAVVRKINSIKKVSFAGVAFVPGAVETKTVEVPLAGKKRIEKGSSLKETLKLLKSGNSIADVAQKRALAKGTIEEHVARLIKSGDINIRDIMEEGRIITISDVIRDLGVEALQPIKNKLGVEYSYGEIRAVQAYLQMSENLV